MCVDKRCRDSLMRKDNQNYATNEEKNQAEHKKEVFKLIESGLSNPEIAAITGLSYTEVIYYRINYERRCKKWKQNLHTVISVLLLGTKMK